MKIDIFSHILPVNYRKALLKAIPQSQTNLYLPILAVPMLSDLSLRFKFMDSFEGLMHVLTLSSPPIEEIAGPEDSPDLAKLVNDEMAELVTKYPGRFIGATAILPMNNPGAALKEAERAINELKLKGIQVFTPVNDRPLDSPEFMPLYEMMAKHNLPIWIHPTRNIDYADYRTEKESRYSIFSIFGWPFETAVAMTRLVFSGVYDKWPDIKFITHHCGGMVPFFNHRIESIYAKARSLSNTKNKLAKSPTEYYKMFYNDTALYGGTPSLMCGYAMFGAGHMVFGTDMPLGDTQGGNFNTGQTIEAIEHMDIIPSEKEMILYSNARKLLNLD